MAQLVYQVIQKPIEQRLIDAASIYWDVDRMYFYKVCGKEESTAFYRRSIVYTLIKQNTTYSFKEIAGLFGFKSHSAVLKAIDEIDAQRKVLRQVSNDLNQILHLADKLDADFITTEVKLINNKIEKI
jgi:chromosomal replication initiation ATPase DnaA